MEKFPEKKYAIVIDSLELPENVSKDQFSSLILEHTVDKTANFETVHIRLDNKDNKDSSDTVKVINLRFRMRELIEEVINRLASIWGGNPISIIWNVIQFVKEVNKLSNILISENDAKILVSLWLIKLEKPQNIWPNIDDLYQYFGNEVTEVDIKKSIENLEKLACIVREFDGQIKIVEDIEF